MNARECHYTTDHIKALLSLASVDERCSRQIERCARLLPLDTNAPLDASSRANCYFVKEGKNVWRLVAELPSSEVSAWIYYDARGSAIMVWQSAFGGVRLVPPL